MKRYSYWTTRDGVRKRSVTVKRKRTVIKITYRLVTYKRRRKKITYWREVKREVKRKVKRKVEQVPPIEQVPPEQIEQIQPSESGQITWVELSDLLFRRAINDEVMFVKFYFRGELLFSDKVSQFFIYMNELQRILRQHYLSEGDTSSEYWRVTLFPYTIEEKIFTVWFS